MARPYRRQGLEGLPLRRRERLSGRKAAFIAMAVTSIHVPSRSGLRVPRPLPGAFVQVLPVVTYHATRSERCPRLSVEEMQVEGCCSLYVSLDYYCPAMPI